MKKIFCFFFLLLLLLTGSNSFSFNILETSDNNQFATDFLLPQIEEALSKILDMYLDTVNLFLKTCKNEIKKRI